MPSPLANIRTANLITTAGAGCGLAAVALWVRGADSASLTCLIAAVLLDNLDGLIARRMGQTSAFGEQLDSLADAVSFLVVPAVLVVLMSEGGVFPSIAGALFAVAGLWRLAHFNLHGMAEPGVFRGVPTTLVGAWFTVGWAGLRVSPLAPWTAEILSGALLLAAPAMLATFPVGKRGLAVKALWVLLLPTLVAAWWPVQ